MNKEIVKKFKGYFASMNLNDDSALGEIYAENVEFQDPVHRINGLSELRTYFSRLNKNLIEGSFNFTDESIIDDKVYLTWEMNLRLKKPKKKVKAQGISVLQVTDKVISHRDYFDAGELFYENIPVLGSIIRVFKKRI